MSKAESVVGAATGLHEPAGSCIDERRRRKLPPRRLRPCVAREHESAFVFGDRGFSVAASEPDSGAHRPHLVLCNVRRAGLALGNKLVGY